MIKPKVVCASDTLFDLDCLQSLLAKSDVLFIKKIINLSELSHHAYITDFDIMVLDVCENTDSNILNHVFQLYHDKKIMILTSSNNHYFLASMLHFGARGCFIKSSSGKSFIESLIDLNTNNAYLPADLFNKLYCELPTKFNHGVIRTIDHTDHEVPILDLEILTSREHEILKLIIIGDSTCEIADKLFISELTVSTHRKHIMKKLGVKNVTTLIRCAVEQGVF